MSKKMIFRLMILGGCALLVLQFSHRVSSQDYEPCHSDEKQVTDSNGGSKCVPRPTQATFNAVDCVRDFKVSSTTKLIIPLDYNGNAQPWNAHLEGFEFKNVCTMVTK